MIPKLQKWLGVGLIGAFIGDPLYGQGSDFKGYEIRVIRPRYMAKRNRLELGAQTTLIMNQSFIYSLLATGLLDYHFTEMFALELSGSYGFSIDKEDKRVLEREFEINTQILRTQYMASGGILWTPIYGKSQLPSGRVVYFDTFLTLQGGITGIEYTYEQCESPTSETQDKVPPKPSPVVKSYPTMTVGIGQKYFLTESFGLRFDVRNSFFQYNKGDGSCTPEVSGQTDVQPNVTLQFGASTFF